jgi:hypothetical protein
VPGQYSKPDSRLAGRAAQAAAPASASRRVGSYIERPDRTSLFFKDWGTADPVVFVHSAGNSSDVWAYSMINVVKQGFRCVAFDRRGHGRSSVPSGGYDYDTLADDLAGVIEAFDLRKVTLVGHSMGCGEVVRYLTPHGSRRPGHRYHGEQESRFMESVYVESQGREEPGLLRLERLSRDRGKLLTSVPWIASAALQLELLLPPLL